MWFCAEIGPNGEVSRGQLTRAAAATLILRSIYPATNGNPEAFGAYSATPYFPTDVPATHPNFPYIQRFYELGITTGCGTGQFCPDRPITYGELATFAIRARQIRDTGVVTPLDCTAPAGTFSNFNCNPYFSDVPQSSNFFPYVQKAYELLNAQNLRYSDPACPAGSFCPSNSVLRGYFGIYAVSLIMKEPAPWILPNGNTLPAVLAPNNTQEGVSSACDNPGVVAENHFIVVDPNNAYAYGRTSLSPQPVSPQLWTTYLFRNLVANSNTFTQDLRIGGAADAALQTPSFALGAAQTESFHTTHGVISGCTNTADQPHILATADSGITGTGNLPAPWSSQDIGTGGIPGYTLYSPGAGGNTAFFTMGGSGAAVWNNTDFFRFMSQSFGTSSTLKAHVSQFQTASPTSKAGLMFRETLAPTSNNVFLTADANGAILLQARTPTFPNTSAIAWGPLWANNRWLKLERSGDLFTGYSSPDGTNWTTVGSTTVSMAATIYGGLAVSAENYGAAALATGIFDNVSVSGVNITLNTSPQGLRILADGATCTAPCAFQWVPGSTHTVNTATATQQPPPNTNYIPASWSDGGAASHNIITPSTDTAYTANFTVQYYLTTTASPATGGSIALNPSGGWYNAGTAVSVTATPTTGYYFFAFSGALSGLTNPQTVTLNAPATVGATFYLLYQTVTSSPQGLQLTVDGIPCTTPCSFSWSPGSLHTIAVPNTTIWNGSTRYVFSNWSDAGMQSHTVTTPAQPASYTAAFTTQYYLTTSVNPATGGSISPPSGWFTGGTTLAVSASPATGYSFTGFNGALSGIQTPQSVTLSGPLNVGAVFTVGTSGTAACSASPNPAKVGDIVTFTATASGGSGTNTFTWSGAVSGTGPSPSFVPMSPGGYQATVSVNQGTAQPCSVSVATPALAAFRDCIGPGGTGLICQLPAGTHVVPPPLSVANGIVQDYLTINRSGVDKDHQLLITGTGVAPGDVVLQRGTWQVAPMPDQAPKADRVMFAPFDSVTWITISYLTIDGNRYAPGLNCLDGNGKYWDLDLSKGGIFTVQWVDFINAPGTAFELGGHGSPAGGYASSISFCHFGSGTNGLQIVDAPQSATRGTAVWLDGEYTGAWYNAISYAGTAGITLNGSNQIVYGNRLFNNRYEISDGSGGGQIFLGPTSSTASVAGNVIDGNFWPPPVTVPPLATGCTSPSPLSLNSGVEGYGFGHRFFNNEIESHTGSGMQFAGSEPTGRITISSANPWDASDAPRYVEQNKLGGISFLGTQWCAGNDYYKDHPCRPAQGVVLDDVLVRNNAVSSVGLDGVSEDNTVSSITLDATAQYVTYTGFFNDACMYGNATDDKPKGTYSLLHDAPVNYDKYRGGACPNPPWPSVQPPASPHRPGWPW